ncbi:MAG: HAMP domain-containing histidine kinase [Micromonosporaceae bacterium]|nr:HAMP domain-containing histidine kinase [Micromonosporaceae bacterium]
MRGRPTPECSDLIPPWRGGPLLREFERAELAADLRRRLAQDGLSGLVRAAVISEDRHIGCLAFGYAGAFPRQDSAECSAIALLAACVAGLYVVGDPAASFRGEGEPKGGMSEEDNDLFISVTSHELRTPVTVIRGYAETLADRWEQLDEHARRSAASVIRQRARDLGRLLDRLLSAVGDGLSPASLAVAMPFELPDALRCAVEELPNDLRSAVTLRLPATLPKAFGDRGVMATLVLELVTNACKYSEGQASVEVTAGADAEGIWLRVSDRGIGIRPEHVERAFERFWQSERDRRRRAGGVGLGLYLVRKLVERHRGWVSLRPREGGGTIAEVRLLRADLTSEGA